MRLALSSYSPVMRILHVLDHSLPLHSGYTFRTAALLREQHALGWETFHVTSPKQGKSDLPYQDADGLRFYRSRMPSGMLAGWPIGREIALMNALERRIEEVVEEIKPDLLHAHSPVLNALPAIKVARRHGLPVVYEIRAFWEDAAVDHGTTTEGSLRYRITRALETYALRKVDYAFTICEGLRKDIVGRGIPADRVTVIPNAVDVENFTLSEPADPTLLEQLRLTGKTVIGFIGSFYAYEGLDLLIKSFPLVRQQIPDLALLLVGGGPQEENLKAQVAALGLEKDVVFTGRVPHAEVQRYYDLIDVLAYPRHSMRLTELVTPLKPLEAMAQGRLFVASEVGGHRELVRHGETGILFKPDDPAALADAMIKLLADKASWPAIRAAGRRFVEDERNWRNSVANYVGVYQRLTGKQASA